MNRNIPSNSLRQPTARCRHSPGYTAFEGADVPAVLGALAPEVLWIEAEGFPHGGT
ncbi:MAG: hypothetical protein K0Q43_5094 [Ramlibacter sp.]|jgi:hypothetical protein|nr:hypothetical protein [Ramlibacter sp.]